MNARALGHGKDVDDLVRPRRVGHADLHGIEMAAHVGGIDMAEGHVEPGAEPADLFRRRHDRLGIAEPLAHRVAAGHMPQRAVFQFSADADNGALAIAVDGGRVAAQRRDQPVGQVEAQRLQVVHEAHDVFDIATGERVGDHGGGSGAVARRGWRRAALVADLLDGDDDLADLDLRHGRQLLRATGTVWRV